MSLEAETVIRHSAADIVEAYITRDFHEHLAGKVGSTLKSFEVKGQTSGAFEIVSEQSMPVDRLPDIAKKIVKGQVNVTITEAWNGADAEGSRRSDMSIEIAQAPVSAVAAQVLHARGETETLATVRGDVKTSIPLIGNKLKAAAEPYLKRFAQLQAREVSAWLEKSH